MGGEEDFFPDGWGEEGKVKDIMNNYRTSKRVGIALVSASFSLAIYGAIVYNCFNGVEPITKFVLENIVR